MIHRNFRLAALSLLLAFLFSANRANARVTVAWDFQQLYHYADLVAIVSHVETVRSSGKLIGHGDPSRYESFQTSMKIDLVLKGNAKIGDLIKLQHFQYSKKIGLITNGAGFVDFSGKMETEYIVFLEPDGSGAYVPVSGHYDASWSVRGISPRMMAAGGRAWPVK